MIFSARALIQTIACAPGVHNEFVNLLVTFIAAKPVDGVCSAVIVRGLAVVVPGRAVVIVRYVFPVRIFIAGEFYVIDGYFFTRCLAGVSDDSRDPLVVVAYGVDAGGTVQDHIVVLAGTTIHIGNMLAGFFATGAAVDAIFSQSLVAKLCCGVAF